MNQPIIVLVAVLVFGIALPWLKGLDFLNPILILCYPSLGALFVTPAAADLGAQRPGRRPMISGMAFLLAYGWCLSLTLLASALVTVNLTHWQGRALIPSTRFLVAATLLGLCACFTIIAFGTALGRVQGVAAARNTLRTALLLLVLVLAFGSRFLPENWQSAVQRQLTTPGLTVLAFRTSAALLLVGGAVAASTLATTRVRVQ